MKSLDERIASGVPDGILKDLCRGKTVKAWLCDGTREDGAKVRVWVDADKKMLVIKGCEKPFWEIQK